MCASTTMTLAGGRLRQRHALPRRADVPRDRTGDAHLRKRRRPDQLPKGYGAAGVHRRHGRPRFAWNEIPLAENSPTRAASSCRSARSTRRSCIRLRFSAWAIRTRSSGQGRPAYDLSKIGPLLENHPIFPERANISLCAVVERAHIVVRTWERGAGLTRACGSPPVRRRSQPRAAQE